MEGLYSKLHDKYTKLKSQKYAEIESINLDQEVKFMEYKSAADELIEHLRNENQRLRSQIIDLRTEMASIRSSRADQHGELNENQNEATARPEDLRNEGVHHTAGKDKTENSQSVMSGSGRVESDTIDILNSNSKRKRRTGSTQDEFNADILKSSSTRKHSRHRGIAEEVAITQSANCRVPVIDSASDEFRQIALLGTGSGIDQPACCIRTQDLSGKSVNAGSTAKCVFQDLIGCLLRMNLSATIQADGICISALHQSSGYSFRLTLVEKVSQGEGEWVYDPISLGTLEGVAPEWMKEVIIFSMLMSPIFFERVLQVVK